MEKIGHDIKVGWEDVVKYLPTVSVLAELIFPQAKAIPAVVNSLNLIQQAVADGYWTFTEPADEPDPTKQFIEHDGE